MKALVNQEIKATDPTATGMIGITTLTDTGGTAPANSDIATFFSLTHTGRQPSTRLRAASC